MSSKTIIPKQIILHHTSSSRDKTTLQDVDAWHKLRWPEFKSSLNFWVGYHFVITGDGKLTQTRRENEMGAHSVPNDGKIGVCLTGNFEIEMPSKEQLYTLQVFLEEIKSRYGWQDERIKAHREVNQTLCCGKNLYDWLKKYRQVSFLRRQIEKLKALLEILLKGRR